MQVKAGRGEAGRPLEPGDVLAHQLSHFVNTLHQFVMDRLLHGAWLELEQVGPIMTVATQMFLQLFMLHCRVLAGRIAMLTSPRQAKVLGNQNICKGQCMQQHTVLRCVCVGLTILVTDVAYAASDVL